MSEDPLQKEQIVSWFETRQKMLEGSKTTMAAIRESYTEKPGAAVNFHTHDSIGQIIISVSGEIDFEVLRVFDGEKEFITHLQVPSLDDLALESAYQDFLRCMTRTN